MKNVIYKINCLDCDNKYIGETGRQLEQRISEHKKLVTTTTESQNTKNSKIREHVKNSGHSFDFENT